MGKEKDPAFLFYSKDWIQGTAGLMPDEKGVYIDLLAHQHQDGALPNDPKRLARMVGLTQSEFDAIWVNLKSKFSTSEENRLVNQKLIKITTERSTKAHTKSILSRYAILIREVKNCPADIINKIKLSFNVSDFECFEINEAIFRLNTWFTERFTSALAIANEDVNKDRIEVSKGGSGEKKEERKGWNQMPGQEAQDLELPELKAGAVHQLLVLQGSKEATKDDVLKLWGIFKVQNLNGSKFYNSENDVFSHFINWSKTQKINGSHQQGIGNGSTKLGTSAARIDTAKKW